MDFLVGGNCGWRIVISAMILRVPRPSAASPFHSERAGMEGRRAMSDSNNRIRHDVEFCREVAERIGLGFELPSKNDAVGPNGPKIKSEPVLETAA
jgi:hypothetical protein